MPFKPIDTDGTAPPAQYFEPDPATVEACAKVLADMLAKAKDKHAKKGLGKGFGSRLNRVRTLGEALSAIRSLIPNSANEIHSSDGGVEGHACKEAIRAKPQYGETHWRGSRTPSAVKGIESRVVAEDAPRVRHSAEGRSEPASCIPDQPEAAHGNGCRDRAGIKPGSSEAIPSGYADYTPVTVRAHTAIAKVEGRS